MKWPSRRRLCPNPRRGRSIVQGTFWIGVSLFCLGMMGSGCSLTPSPPAPTPEARRLATENLAAQHGWQSQIIFTPGFALQAYLPKPGLNTKNLWIYIEGDGSAWLTASRPSTDPTPENPVALRMALAHPDANAAYLGRPCQYQKVIGRNCPSRYWTEARFAPEVIEAENVALDLLKQQAGANKLTLVGYSGGATIALLLASRRQDIDQIITVAGNLDHRAWTRFHALQPLEKSLNPADDIERLQQIRQAHLVGGKDDVIPPALTRDFLARYAAASKPAIHIEPGFDHHCCWAEYWPKLLTDIAQRP